MSSSRFQRLGPVFVVAVAICVMLGWSAVSTFLAAARAAEMSAQLALFDEAEGLLDAYHAAHGHYPASLDSLSFSFPDGGDESTLALLEYESDGETYSLTTTNVYSSEVLRVTR